MAIIFKILIKHSMYVLLFFFITEDRNLKIWQVSRLNKIYDQLTIRYDKNNTYFAALKTTCISEIENNVK
jgi:hypothetical protein